MDDVIEQSRITYEQKAEHLLEDKTKLRKIVSDGNKAILSWKEQMWNFVNSVSEHLLSKVETTFKLHDDIIRQHTEKLRALNRDILLCESEPQSLKDKMEAMSSINWDSSFEEAFSFIVIEKQNNNPYLVKAHLNESLLPTDTTFLSVLSVGTSKYEQSLVCFHGSLTQTENALKTKSSPSSCPATPIFRESSANKKNVTFYPKTIILESGDSEKDKIDKEGIGKILSSPPLDQSDLSNSASKKYRKDITPSEKTNKVENDKCENKKSFGFEKKLDFSDFEKIGGTFGTSLIFESSIKFKYEGFGPTDLAQDTNNNLFVCSPTFGKVAVLDIQSGFEKGYLKLPKGAFISPRNVCLYQNSILILDSIGLHVFLTGGLYSKSLFEKEAENFRGLSVSGNSVLSLDIKSNEHLIIVFLDLQQEIISKRIKIPLFDVSSLKCRFLDCFNSSVVVSDMNQGRVYMIHLITEKCLRIDENKLEKATGVLFDSLGQILIGDISRRTLEYFDAKGSWIKSLSLSQIFPVGLSYYKSQLFVVNNKGHSVVKFLF